MSTYPPQRCGIATFTHALAAAAGGREIAALVPPEPASPYPDEVHHRIRRDEPGDYAHVARSLGSCVDVVSIQHEYGIWGGADGERVLDFAGALRVPAVATLHTILRQPTARQRRVLTDLIAAVDATVVMSRSAAALLDAAYGVDPHKVHVIPHGVPDLPLIDPADMRTAVGLAGRRLLLSFGLLGPGKGYESVIEALPAVVARHPSLCFVIVGATHPDLVRREGETYRAGLVARVKALGMTHHVQFVDRFVTRVELSRWLEAADVFVTPYPNLEQIVSGTLTDAMGAGRAIVSTPYTYAVELLAGGRGKLVEHGSPTALAAALDEVLSDDALRADLGRRAYAHSRGMVWSRVGASYRELFERVTRREPIIVPAVRRSLAAVDA